MSHPTSELVALLDGALDPAERAAVERHLSGCASCRAERDRLARTLAVLSRLPAAPAPSPTFEARFHARLRQSAAERARPSPWRRLGWRPLAPGLAGLAAAAGLFLHAQRQRADETFLAEHLDLFENFEAVRSVGAVESPEDLQVAMHLDELGKERP